MERLKFPSISTRIDNIIRAGQSEIADKILYWETPDVEWRDGEFSVSAQATRHNGRNHNNRWESVKIYLNRIVNVITYYEIKEATTLFELALWKSNMNQTEAEQTNITNRDEYRIEVPGSVKDIILQYYHKG